MMMMMMMMTEMVFETLVQYGHVTRLIAQEDYIKMSQPSSLKSISSSQLRLGLPSGLLPGGFPTKIFKPFSFPQCVLHVTPI
jgi:hypothetical protein